MSRRFPTRVLLLVGMLFTAGLLHVLSPRPFDSIIPRIFPAEARRPLTYASGLAEVVAGGLLLAPRTRRVGSLLTQALFIAILPANIDAALRGGYPGLSGFAGSTTAAWLRVPLQIPLILWAASAGRPTNVATEDG